MSAARAAVIAAILLFASPALAAAVKRAEIGFAPGAAEISPVVKARIARLLAVLEADVANGALIEVEAYGRGRQARVLAVERAADVRQALIDGGLPAERIVARVSDEGEPADTLVIFVRR